MMVEADEAPATVGVGSFTRVLSLLPPLDGLFLLLFSPSPVAVAAAALTNAEEADSPSCCSGTFN
jgi:hypothetical protein